jgi:putative oxidoreductase
MKALLFNTNNDYTGFIARVTIGLILSPHGAQKVFGWFGGPGFTNEMNYFTQTANLPWIIGFLVIVIEFVGSLCMILGFATRLWSIAVIILFTGMIVKVHLANGFFMNWFGNQGGEGYEYHLLVIGIAGIVLLNGSGKYALDKYLTVRKAK